VWFVVLGWVDFAEPSDLEIWRIVDRAGWWLKELGEVYKGF